ncbi:hypothetical protein K466DRAFT_600985 [Polyporus arcularius HHB13444]|uniref:Uncharacterized protein n=1 Tax=Polyporus arcularius HHB13444 TaxID=1314778 RepID=A0A5C3PBR5_9APHY|nr:hypothetical protein K466DRAFT_600985 [Polyporus arcularius HHB13444]
MSCPIYTPILPDIPAVDGWIPDYPSLADIHTSTRLLHIVITSILVVTVSSFLEELVALSRHPTSTLCGHVRLLLAAVGQLVDNVKLFFTSVALGVFSLFSAAIHLVCLGSYVLYRVLVRAWLAPFRIACCVLRLLLVIFETAIRVVMRLQSVCIRFSHGLQRAWNGVSDRTTTTYNVVTQSCLKAVVRWGESAQRQLRNDTVATGVFAPAQRWLRGFSHPASLSGPISTSSSERTSTFKLAIRVEATPRGFDVNSQDVTSSSSCHSSSCSVRVAYSPSQSISPASNHLRPNLHDSEETLYDSELDDDSQVPVDVDRSDLDSASTLDEPLASSTSLVLRPLAFKKPLNPAAPAFVLSPKLRIFLAHIPGIDPALRSPLVGSALPPETRVAQLAMTFPHSPQLDGLLASTPGRIEDLDDTANGDEPEQGQQKKTHGKRVPTWLRRQRKRERMAAEMAEEAESRMFQKTQTDGAWTSLDARSSASSRLQAAAYRAVMRGTESMSLERLAMEVAGKVVDDDE